VKRIAAAACGLTVVACCVWMLTQPVNQRPLNLNNASDSSARSAALLNQSDLASLSTASHCVYVVLSPDCPISTSCIPTLNRLHLQFGRLGFQFVGIVPGSVADVVETEQHLTEFAISFPLVFDADNTVCRRLGATHTPQVVVQSDGHDVYSGRIDNLYADIGRKRNVATELDLLDALNAIHEGRPVARSRTRPIGCLIPHPRHALRGTADPRVPTARVTFSRDVAPILFDHCSSCHRPDTAAPFSLLTYADAREHSAQIAEVVERRLMPPWKAEPGFNAFANEHRLRPEEIAIITDWVQSEQLEGDARQMPDIPEYHSDWHLGPPDLELIMPEPFDVPADGPDVYRHFVIPSGLTEHRLVNAVDFRPGAPEVVHHSIMYFDLTGQARALDAADPGPGYSRIGSPGFQVSGSLGGWGPGGTPRRLPIGMGRALLKGADLVVQIHYHPIGRPMRDQSRIGLYFAPPGSRHEVTEVMVADVDLKIPAGARHHHHHAEYELPVDTILFDATPHMHVLGREIRAAATLPDGTKQPLIWIRDWDFYWQDNYVFAEPLRLPAGTVIALDCWYDNSNANPLNPNSPPQDVVWGDFSTDEMGICYFQATTEQWDDYVTLNEHATAYFADLWERYQAQQSVGVGETTDVQQQIP
jgi:hypothetical protein